MLNIFTIIQRQRRLMKETTLCVVRGDVSFMAGSHVGRATGSNIVQWEVYGVFVAINGEKKRSE